MTDDSANVGHVFNVPVSGSRERAGYRLAPPWTHDHASRRQFICSSAALAALLFSVPGCNFHWPDPPFVYETTTVTGRIACGGEPIHGGWITLAPAEQTIGDHTIKPINADGTFTVADAPVGSLQVRIALRQAVQAGILQQYPQLAARLQEIRGPASRIRIASKRNEPTRFDFDLAWSAITANP